MNKPERKRKLMRERIQHGDRMKVNRTDPDEHSSEIGKVLKMQPECDKFFQYTNMKSERAIRTLLKQRYMVRRTDILTKRFVRQEDLMDSDRDMAGPVAIERTLLFLRNVLARVPGRLGYNDMLMFLLTTGPLAISVTEASSLMSTTVQNGHYMAGKLKEQGYIEEIVSGGPNGPRRKGKMIGTIFTRTTRGDALYRRVVEKFDTRNFGAIADILDKQVRSVPIPALIKARERQVDLTRDLNIDKDPDIIVEPDNQEK